MTVIWKKHELESREALLESLQEHAPVPALVPAEPPERHDEPGAAAADRQLRLLNRLATELVQERERLLTELRPELLALALGVAEQIVRHDCQSHRDTALRTMNEGLEQIHFASKIAVRLHPDDLACLQEHPGVSQRHAAELQFIADETIEPGGCYLETDRGSLDATITTQLARMRELLRPANG